MTTKVPQVVDPFEPRVPPRRHGRLRRHVFRLPFTFRYIEIVTIRGGFLRHDGLRNNDRSGHGLQAVTLTSHGAAFKGPPLPWKAKLEIDP